MNKLGIRLIGLVSFISGTVLFVYSVKYISAEWPQIFVGLLSIFFSAMGFGFLIMPLESLEKDMPEDGSKSG